MQPKWDSFPLLLLPLFRLVGFFPSHRTVNQSWVICFDLIPEFSRLAHPKACIHQLRVAFSPRSYHQVGQEDVKVCFCWPVSNFFWCLSGTFKIYLGLCFKPPRVPFAIFLWSSLRRSRWMLLVQAPLLPREAISSTSLCLRPSLIAASAMACMAAAESLPLPHKSSILFARLLSMFFKQEAWPSSRPPPFLLFLSSSAYASFCFTPTIVEPKQQDMH